MVKAESGKKETSVIVNRRTAVFVTWPKDVLVARVRNPGMVSPAQTIIVPTIKFQALVPASDKRIFGGRDGKGKRSEKHLLDTPPGCTGWIIDQLPVASWSLAVNYFPLAASK